MPDQSAGRVEAMVSTGTETLVKIGATITKSDDNIQRYSIEKVFTITKICSLHKMNNFFAFILFQIYLQRQCVFGSDIAKPTHGSYFRSNCIRSCRMESIIALCNCIPFFYLDLKSFSVNSTKVCTLASVPCLSHYNGIYTYMN